MQISMKCSVAVHCLIFIYEAKGITKVTSNLLAESTGCNPVVIRTILSALKKSGAYHRTARNRRSSFMYGSLPNHSFPNLYCPGARWASFSHRNSSLPESSVSGSPEYQESTADPLPQSRGCHQGSHGTNHFTVHDRRIPSIGKPVGLV